MEGVVNGLPVPMAAPPVDAEYHFIVPALLVAARFTVPASQRLAGVVDVMLGVVFIVATTGVLTEVQVVVEASA